MSNYQTQLRSRKELRIRFAEGIKSLFCPPYLRIIPIIALTVLFYLALSNRSAVFNTSIMPGQLSKIVDYIKIAAIGSVYIAFLFTLFVKLGKPQKYKYVENAVLIAFGLKSEPELCPIFISCTKLNTGAKRWEFFSQWVTMTEWQNNIDTICHALGEHLVGELSYDGNSRQLIVFYTKLGAAAVNRGEFRDNEF